LAAVNVAACGRLAVGQEERAGQTVESNLPPHFLVLRLSAGMLNSLVDKQIDVLAPVRDVVLGTPVAGTARVTGQPRVVLDPSPDQARFAVVVTGTVHSRTVGRSGPATVYGRSITHFTATERIVFDPGKGFFAAAPEITTTTQVHTDRIEVNRGGLIGRIVRRRAWEEVASQKAELTAIARQRATARIAAAFKRHMDERVAQLNQAVEFRALVASLRDQETGTPQIICTTTPQYIEIADTLASDRTTIDLPVLAAASGANAPIEIWIHQRLVPERMAKVLKEALSSPDQNALVQTLATLPGPLAKEAAAALASLVVDNQIDVQTLGEWTVVEVNARLPATVVVARSIQR
jgi:hypothetical protein